MSKVLNWLLKSSSNPEKISLTIKSAAPFILAVAALLKLDLVEGDLDQLAEGLVAVVSGAFLVYGFARKVVLSFKREES